MKPLFPSYMLKGHAKKAMYGNFLKAAAIVMIPPLVIIAVSLLLFNFVPGFKAAFEVTLSGSFESAQARMEYINSLFGKYIWAVQLINVLFAFLSIGAVNLMLGLLRGKEVRIRNIFKFYEKWYIAAIYPALSLLVTVAADKLLEALESAAIGEAYVYFAYLAIEILFMLISFKLMFFEYALCDNGCTDFAGAVKTSWRMTGLNTFFSALTLAVSFIGWLVLALMTAGFLFIYLLPYMTLSFAALYEQCRLLQTE